MIDFSGNSLQRKAALVAGTGLLLMTILAVSAVYFIFEKLVVSGDAGATVNNILAGEMQFRIGIVCLYMVAVLDVVVAWSLYVFLKPANKNLALLAAWFRVVYASILTVSLFGYTNILRLLGGAPYVNGIDTSKLHADVMLSLAGFDDGWAIGLVFFGIHLVILGFLVFKSGYVPKVLGVLLVIAGAAYAADSFGRFLFPNYAVELATFLGWGELLFMLWLLYIGLKAPNTFLNVDS